MSDMADRNLQLARLLAWYREMGADSAIEDAAVDWRARGNAAPGAGFSLGGQSGPPTEARAATSPPAKGAAPAPPAPRTGAAPPKMAPPKIQPSPASITAPPRSFAGLPPDAAVMAARSSASSARSLDELQAALMRFEGCALKATAKTLCFYRGAARARVMIIGEAPGRDEDLAGRPFVGRAGQLLDLMLAAIGLGEADVHITNIVYWRPPGNRTPTPAEAQSCRPFLERQADLVGPDFLLALGGAAAKHVFDVADGILRVRGKWREVQFGEKRLRAIATLHPAYLLRQPSAKGLAWRDLLAVRSALDGRHD